MREVSSTGVGPCAPLPRGVRAYLPRTKSAFELLFLQTFDQNIFPLLLFI